MKKFLQLFTCLALVAGITTSNAQISFFDDFESYDDGAYLAASSSDWTTWSGNAGTAEDATITTEQAFSGTKSAKYFSAANSDGPIDQVLNFGGQQSSGVLLYEMYMYIETGAYFNFQGNATIGQIWTSNTWFYDDGTFVVSNSDNALAVSGEFTQNEWFKLTFEVDLTFNVWTVKINDEVMGSWANPYNYIASIDIYPLQGNRFYIDDVNFQYTPHDFLDLDLAIFNATVPAQCFLGKEYPVSAEVKNVGLNTVSSFNITWSDGVNSETKAVSGESIGSLQTFMVEFDQGYVGDPANTTITISIDSQNGTGDNEPGNDSRDFEVLDVVTPVPDKVMFVEEATGTWCPWCTRGTAWMDKMNHDYGEYFAGIAVHNNDPMMDTEYDAGIRSFPGFSGFPSVVVDRENLTDPGQLESEMFKQVVKPPVVQLYNEVNYHADSRTLYIKVNGIMKQSMTGNFIMNAIVREDNVTGSGQGWAQANAYAGGGNGEMFGFENLPNPIPADMMEYDFVGRKVLGGFNGETAPALPTSLNQGETYTVEYNYTIPEDYDEENIVIVSTFVLPNGVVSTANVTYFADFNATGTEVVQDHPAFEGIAPNPFNDVSYVQLKLDNPEDVSIQLISATGQLVSSRDYGKLSGGQLLPINGENMPSGLYFVKVNIGNTIISRTVSISH